MTGPPDRDGAIDPGSGRKAFLRDAFARLRDYGAVTAGNLLGSLAGFVAVVAIVDQVGAAGFGQVSLALALLAYAVVVGSCGTEVYSVKEVAASPERAEEMVALVLALRTVVSVVVGAALLLLARLAPELRNVSTLLAILTVSLLANAWTIGWLPLARQKMGAVAAVQALPNVLYLGLLLAFLPTGGGLQTVAWCRVAADLLVAAGVLVWARWSGLRLRLPDSATRVADLARAAWPLAASRFVSGRSMSTDLVVVGLLVAPAALGHYAGAVRLYGFAMTSVGIYFMTSLPRVAREASVSPVSMRDSIRTSLRLMLPLCLVASVLVAMLARSLLALFFGDDFVAAAPALAILMAAIPVSLVAQHLRQVLVVRNRLRLELRLGGFAALVHVAGKVALVPTLGLRGAAIGTLAGELAFLTLLWRVTRDELRAEVAG